MIVSRNANLAYVILKKHKNGQTLFQNLSN